MQHWNEGVARMQLQYLQASLSYNYYYHDCVACAGTLSTRQIRTPNEQEDARDHISVCIHQDLTAKQKWYLPVYDYACACIYYVGIRNNRVYVRISIHVLHPTQDRMNFSRFKGSFLKAPRAVVPRYSVHAIHYHYGKDIEDVSFFVLERVTDLSRIQSSIQPERGQAN